MHTFLHYHHYICFHVCHDLETLVNRTHWRVAEVYQVCNKIYELLIETFKNNTEISSLLLWEIFDAA